MPPASGDPPVCYIRNWICFGEGVWKGQLYSRAECIQMGRNFQRLSTGPDPAIVPQVKLAHDSEQDLAKWLEASKGFPSLGKVYGMRVSPDGLCSFDLELPTQIGALRNAGRYVDGSIEIAPPLPDPEHATTKLYPVLVAIGLLGEEQPAVPLRYPMPKAVFADGREVPAENDLTPLAQAMAEVAKAFSAKGRSFSGYGSRFSYRGREFTTTVARFSAMTPLGKQPMPMTPEQKAALKAAPFNWTDEQIAKAEMACGDAMAAVPPTDTPPAPAPQPGAAMSDPPKDEEGPLKTMSEMSKKFAADPATPSYAKDMMSAMHAFASACSKRFAATEAAVGEMQKDKPELKAAAAFTQTFKARLEADKRAAVEAVVDEAIGAGKLTRNDKSAYMTEGLTKDNVATFAAGTAHAGKTAFEVWKAELLGRKPSRFFSADPVFKEEPVEPGSLATDPFCQAALRTLPGGRPLAYPIPEPAKK